MSTCRRMCHTDVGAPLYYGYKRDGIYAFLDVLFVTGYNEKFVLNYSREERILTVNYEAPHGYVVGQLLQFSGSTTTKLNINHRVIEVPSTNSLKIYIKDDTYDTYPEASNETGLQTKVAPFGWEKVFESPTQRSYRSRLTKSSKIVFTIKRPTVSTTKFITEGAIAYEVDFSKDIDLETGSSIDSCFTSEKNQFNHTCRYWVVSTNTDDIFNSMNYDTSSETPAPWTCVGDESMVYFMHCPYEPYNDWGNKNSGYRQFDSYTGSNRYPKCYSFGDVNVVDTNEYSTGSSFFFHMYYARADSWEGAITSPENNPFIRPGTWSWWDHYFSAYDPIGSYASARMQTISPAYDSYGYSCSAYMWNAYPQRVVGGITYFDYLAYSDGPSTGVNSVNCFYKGIFKFVKYSDTNFRNLGNIGSTHNRTYPTNEIFKFLFTSNNSPQDWNDIQYYGLYLFELD